MKYFEGSDSSATHDWVPFADLAIIFGIMFENSVLSWVEEHHTEAINRRVVVCIYI